MIFKIGEFGWIPNKYNPFVLENTYRYFQHENLKTEMAASLF